MLKHKNFIKIVKANTFDNFVIKVNLFGVCRFNQDMTGTVLISSSRHLRFLSVVAVQRPKNQLRGKKKKAR